jgi:outer membrane receptor protein involved in Fe transport
LMKKLNQGLLIFGLLAVPALARADAPVKAGGIENLMGQSFMDLLNMPVVSSTLKPTTQKISPGNPYVITSEQMDKLGAISIADALDKMVPGVNISFFPNFNELVGVRGLVTDSNLKTLYMSDSLDIGDHNATGFSGANIGSPLIGDLDRIEVNLGPGALQLGSGAINGYINRISATGASKPGFRAKAEYGSGNARLTELSYGKVQGDEFNWFLYGGYYRNDGVATHKNLSQQDMIAHQGTSFNFSQAPNPPVAPSDIYYGNVKFGKTDDNFRLSARLIYGDQKRQDPLTFDVKAFYYDFNSSTSLFEHPLVYPSSNQWADELKAIMGDNANNGWSYTPFLFYRDQALSISPEMRINFNPSNFVDLAPYYQKIVQYEYPSDWLRTQLNAYGLDGSALKSFSFGYQSRYGLKGVYNNTSFESNDISLGGEWRHTDFRSNHNWNGKDNMMWPYESIDQTWDQYSVFAEDLITLGKWSILPGIRYDWLHAGPISAPDFYSPGTVNEIGAYNNYYLTPRLAGAYQITENDTIKASYSEGFRFVDAAVWGWFYEFPYAGQPDKLLPEVSKNFEVTYEKYVPRYKTDFNVTSYYDIIRHARAWFDVVNNYANASRDIHGIGQEYMFKYLPSEKFEAFFAYGWSRPINSFNISISVANKKDTWAKYPQHMFKTGADYTIGKFTFGILMKLTSGAYVHDITTDTSGDTTTADPAAQALYGVWTLDGDINIKYAITRNANLKLTVKDLIMSNFNQYYNYWQGQYPAMGLRAENPRVYLSVEYKF